MSFILDALKKSENERARQNGPALLEARVVARRRGVPLWAVLVGLVLLANLAVLVVVLVRKPEPPVVVLAPAAMAPVAAPAAAPPAAALPVAPAPVPPPTVEPLPDQPTVILPPAGAMVVNPADYQPARQAANPSPPSSPGEDASLPTAADLTAGGTGLPELHLALHVYDPNPASRFVLVNSQRLREGETNGDGVRIERITPEGAIGSWRGQRFRLPPGE
jgi:general secretion pathway protein B